MDTAVVRLEVALKDRIHKYEDNINIYSKVTEYTVVN
jgi:hypothetical protein